MVGNCMCDRATWAQTRVATECAVFCFCGMINICALPKEKCAAEAIWSMWWVFHSGRRGLPQNRARWWLIGWRSGIVRTSHGNWEIHANSIMEALQANHCSMDIDGFLLPHDHPRVQRHAQYILRGWRDKVHRSLGSSAMGQTWNVFGKLLRQL